MTSREFNVVCDYCDTNLFNNTGTNLEELTADNFPLSQDVARLVVQWIEARKRQRDSQLAELGHDDCAALGYRLFRYMLRRMDRRRD